MHKIQAMILYPWHHSQSCCIVLVITCNTSVGHMFIKLSTSAVHILPTIYLCHHLSQVMFVTLPVLCICHYLQVVCMYNESLFASHIIFHSTVYKFVSLSACQISSSAGCMCIELCHHIIMFVSLSASCMFVLWSVDHMFVQLLAGRMFVTPWMQCRHRGKINVKHPATHLERNILAAITKPIYPNRPDPAIINRCSVVQREARQATATVKQVNDNSFDTNWAFTANGNCLYKTQCFELV